MLLLWLVEELDIDPSDVFVLGLFCICIILVILYFQLGGKSINSDDMKNATNELQILVLVLAADHMVSRGAQC